MPTQTTPYRPIPKIRVPIRNTADYSPFGVQLDGRTISGDSYRYGFNEKECDSEVSGEGNSYDFGARLYNPRIGRWLSRDPHELAHWLGLLHPWDNGYETEFKEGKRNIMSYDGDESGSSIPPNQYTIESHQIMQITQMFFGGNLNSGDNKETNPRKNNAIDLEKYQYNPSEVELNCGEEKCE